MTHDEAIGLIRPAICRGEAWAELGAGTGTFTLALGDLVGPGGSVWASDRDAAALRALRSLTLPGGARLEVAEADLTRAPALPPVDGILVANALHFVPIREQASVLRELARHLSGGSSTGATTRAPAGKLLLVEYDRGRGNPYVPHPVPLRRFRELATEAGFALPEEVGRRPSRYQGEMYAALAVRAS